MGTMNRLRQNTGVVLWILVIAFGIVWVLQDSGAFDNLGQRTRNIAVVNGEPITYDEFQTALQQQQQQLRQRVGEVSAQMQDMIREQTFNTLVNSQLLQQEMDRLGITVTEDEVLDMVFGDNPDPFIRQQFSDSTGQVNRQLIRNIAQNPQTKQSWLQVEQYLRNKRRSQKMNELIMATVHVTEADVLDAYRRRNTTADVRYVAQRYASIPNDSVSVTEEDLRAYYETHQEDFKREKTFTLDYVTMTKQATAEDTAAVVEDLNDLRDEFAAADQDSLFLAENASARDYTDAYFTADELDAAIADSLFPNPEEGAIYGPIFASQAAHLVKVTDTRPADEAVVHARHILIEGEGAEARQRAQELMERLQQGDASFAALARQYSDDTGSAAQGGDLGWFGRGRMVEPFADAAFNAEVGEIVGPVQTQFGYHVIQVLGKADEQVQMADLAYPLRPSQATLDDIEYQLEDLAYYATESGNFREEAQRMNLEVQQVSVEAGQETIPGLGSSIQLTAFLEGAEQGDVSEVVELDNRYAVLHVQDVQPAGYRPFEAVKSEIRPRVLVQKKQALLRRRMEQALAQTDDLSGLAEALGTEVQAQSGVGFDTNQIPGLGAEPKFAGTVFGLSEGATSGVVTGETAAFVVRVDALNEPGPITEQQRAQLRNQLLQQKRQEVTSQWIASLREKAEIVDNRAQFQ